MDLHCSMELIHFFMELMRALACDGFCMSPWNYPERTMRLPSCSLSAVQNSLLFCFWLVLPWSCVHICFGKLRLLKLDIRT